MKNSEKMKNKFTSRMLFWNQSVDFRDEYYVSQILYTKTMLFILWMFIIFLFLLCLTRVIKTLVETMIYCFRKISENKQSTLRKPRRRKNEIEK